MQFTEKFRRKSEVALSTMATLLSWVFWCVMIGTVTIDFGEGARRPRINGTWIRMGLVIDDMMQNDGGMPECGALPGLSPAQGQLCRLYADHMAAVALGARHALNECRHQFRNRRWNCSLLVDDVNVFGPIISVGSRETAIAHALSSAGVMHSVSRACREGQLASCGCSRMRRPARLQRDWVWGGCGDNLDYGYQFSQKFVDVREKERKFKRGSRENARRLMNLHNNKAGRMAVVKTAKVACKCHGVSGACSLVTCWQQLANFREIGDYLRDRYDGATEVAAGRRGRLQPGDPRVRPPTDADLVYLEESPDYCVRDDKAGVLGTHGRSCNRTSPDSDGCNLLCCGRGYNTFQLRVKERCHCKFKWCCQVECKTCIKATEMHTCK